MMVSMPQRVKAPSPMRMFTLSTETDSEEFSSISANPGQLRAFGMLTQDYIRHTLGFERGGSFPEPLNPLVHSFRPVGDAMRNSSLGTRPFKTMAALGETILIDEA